VIIIIIIINVSHSTEYNNNTGGSYAKTSDLFSIPCTRHTAITKHYRDFGKLRFPRKTTVTAAAGLAEYNSDTLQTLCNIIRFKRIFDEIKSETGIPLRPSGNEITH